MGDVDPFKLSLMSHMRVLNVFLDYLSFCSDLFCIIVIRMSCKCTFQGQRNTLSFFVMDVIAGIFHIRTFNVSLITD